MSIFLLRTHLQGIGGSSGAPFDPRPAVYQHNPTVSAAVNESRRTETSKLISDYVSKEKRAVAAVMQSVRKCPAALALLYNLDQRQRIAATQAALAAGLPMPAMHEQVVTCMQMLNELELTFNTISTSTLEAKETIYRDLRCEVGAPIKTYLTELEHAAGAVELHGGHLSTQRKEAKLASGLINGEEVLSFLSQALTMSSMTYNQKLDMLRHYDTTHQGMERLALSRTRGPKGTIQAINALTEAQQKALKPCSKCGKKFHTAKTCWELHPELKPSDAELKRKAEARKNRKRTRPNGASGNPPKPKDAKKPRFEFPKPAPAPTVNMVTDLTEVNSLDEAVLPNRLFIDSCCSGDLWVMCTTTFFFGPRRKTDNVLATAAAGQTLRIESYGRIGNQEHVAFCPDARRNLMSMGRLHLMGYSFMARPFQPPLILDSDLHCVLTGEYDNKMPHFAMADIQRLAEES